MKTTYFVSGYMRSGTSMMMRALEAGGLTAAYNPIRNQMNNQYGDQYYEPNENGFYELHKSQYQNLDFPMEFEGKLIKCLFGGINKIIPGNYKIVYMLRDFEEIRQSHTAFFGQPPRHTEESYNKLMKYTYGILDLREDCDVTIMQYRDVVNDPINQFNRLVNNGWDIDVNKASEIVDPELCRFRKENLEIGI